MGEMSTSVQLYLTAGDSQVQACPDSMGMWASAPCGVSCSVRLLFASLLANYLMFGKQHWQGRVAPQITSKNVLQCNQATDVPSVWFSGSTNLKFTLAHYTTPPPLLCLPADTQKHAAIVSLQHHLANSHSKTVYALSSSSSTSCKTLLTKHSGPT